MNGLNSESMGVCQHAHTPCKFAHFRVCLGAQEGTWDTRCISILYLMWPERSVALSSMLLEAYKGSWAVTALFMSQPSCRIPQMFNASRLRRTSCPSPASYPFFPGAECPTGSPMVPPRYATDSQHLETWDPHTLLAAENTV